MDRLTIVLCLLVAILSQGCLGDLVCKLRTGKSGASYDLSVEARDAIKYPSGQSGSNFKAIECTCDGSKKDGVVDDSIVQDVMEDLDNDWMDIGVLKFHDCDELDLDSFDNNNDDLAFNLDRKALIFENIKSLIISDTTPSAFGAGDGDLSDEETYSSVYFRNVVFTDLFTSSSNAMKFAEKAEVLFDNVSIDPEDSKPFNIEVSNEFNKRKDGKGAIVKIINSKFTGAEIGNSGLSDNDATFKLFVESQHKGGDIEDDECYFDYIGTTVVSNNTFGVLVTAAVELDGGGKFYFEDNFVALADSDALLVKQVENVVIRRNVFDFALSQPIIDLSFSETADGNSNCDKEDMKDSDVKVNLAGNKFTDFDNSPVKINPDFDGVDTDDFISKRFTSTNNSVKACDCELDETKLDLKSEIGKLQKDSHCTTTVGTETIGGDRDDICNGNFETRSELEDRVKKDTKKKWTVYLIVAVVIVAILTAILTAICMRMCCGGGGNDVTPR